MSEGTFDNLDEAALREMLSKAKAFRVADDLTIEWRGGDRWAVISLDMVVNKDLQQEYEPNPSSRTNEFMTRTRFSLMEAFRIAEAYINKVEPNHVP